MNNRAGILYTQLTALEKRAGILEKNAESALDHFLKLPEAKQTPAAEQRIILKLWELDALQDQMDAIVAELKENGWWASKIAGDAKYIYRKPKTKKVTPPKEPAKQHKVYSTETKAQETRRIAAQKAENRRRERAAAKAEKDAQKAAKAAERAQKAAQPKVIRVPKSKELQKAERGVMDAKIDRNKVDGVFERQRLRDLEWIAEAEADLIKYADTSTADKGPQKRCQARIKIASATERLNTIAERKAARYAELDKRHAKYEAEVQKLVENRSH